MEQTLVIIKPDGVERKLVGKILQRFEDKNLTIAQLKKGRISPEIAKEHYAHIKGRGFFDDMIAFMTSSSVVFLVLEGADVIALVRQMIGATKSLEAQPGTIRGDFGVDGFKNLVHASDSKEAALIEIQRFFG